MEAQGYSTESYEEWKENDMRTELFSESLEEMMEKKAMLEVLKEALGQPDAGRTGTCGESVWRGNECL